MITESKCNNILFSINSRGAFPSHDHRRGDRDGQNDNNHNQRDTGWQMEVIGENHLDPDKAEHESEPCSEVNEALHQAGQQKVERSQAENRANIGGINDERVARNREDCGNRIGRKDQVRDFDHDHGESKWGQHPAAIDAHFKMFAMKFGCNWKYTAARAHHPTLAKIARRMFSKQHSQCSEEEEHAKKIKNEMKPLHQCDTAQDHGATHDERADDSPYQNAMLGKWRNAKMGEDQHEHENVIGAE